MSVGRVCLIELTTIDNSLIAGLSNLHMGFTPVGRVCLIELTTIDNSLIAGLSNLHMGFTPVGRVCLIGLTTIDNSLIAGLSNLHMGFTPVGSFLKFLLASQGEHSCGKPTRVFKPAYHSFTCMCMGSPKTILRTQTFAPSFTEDILKWMSHT